MSDKNSEQQFDKRTLDFLLQRGDISNKDYEKYLSSIPDDEGNFDVLEVGQEEEENALAPEQESA